MVSQSTDPMQNMSSGKLRAALPYEPYYFADTINSLDSDSAIATQLHLQIFGKKIYFKIMFIFNNIQ